MEGAAPSDSALQRVGSCDEVAGELLKLLSALESRLEGVMRPREDVPHVEGPSQVEPSQSPLVTRLRGHQVTLSGACQHVNDLLSRLEV